MPVFDTEKPAEPPELPTTPETLLSDAETLVELSTTEPTTAESEQDYDILIQGSDRKYPAIVIRKKHRGVGAVVRTISRNGQHSGTYADYAEVISAYQQRRQQRRAGSTTVRPATGLGETAGKAGSDTPLQGVVRRENKGNPSGVVARPVDG